MKIRKAVFFTVLLLFLMPVMAAAQNNQIKQVDLGLRQYLPGDIVHLVIEAPEDTNRIKVIMPDYNELDLIYEPRSKLWHGYWEVSMGLKKGVYQAKLIAGDVAGESFQGKSSPFYIAEPVMALMMRISPSREVAEEKLTESERIARERAIGAARIALEEERKAELRGEPPPKRLQPAPPAVAVKPPVKKKIPAVKPRRVKKKPVRVSRPKKDINVTKASLIIAARSYLNKSQYNKAKAKLKALLKIEPDNRDIKTLVNRLEVIGKAKGDN